jgi:hypothetical protein
MSAATASVLAATISGGFAVVVAIIHRFRKENSRDHEVVLGMLRIMHKSQQRTEDKVDKVDERLTEHLASHHEKGMLDNGKRIDKNGVEGNPKVAK